MGQQGPHPTTRGSSRPFSPDLSCKGEKEGYPVEASSLCPRPKPVTPMSPGLFVIALMAPTREDLYAPAPLRFLTVKMIYYMYPMASALASSSTSLSTIIRYRPSLASHPISDLDHSKTDSVVDKQTSNNQSRHSSHGLYRKGSRE